MAPSGLPNKGLKLTGRLAALADEDLGLYPEVLGASAAKAPARSLNLFVRALIAGRARVQVQKG